MNEEQAFDLGQGDGYQGVEPHFRGTWALFAAYHRGYEFGIEEREQDIDTAIL